MLDVHRAWAGSKVRNVNEGERVDIFKERCQSLLWVLPSGVQGTAGAAQRFWKTEEHDIGLRVEGLEALPNALDAAYWLRKAAVEEKAGNIEVR